MKTLAPRQQRILRGIAETALADLAPEMVVTPWVVSLPGWRWIGRRPAFRSFVVSAVACALAIALSDEPQGVRTVLRKVVAAASIFLGLYGIFYAARVFERIYGTVKALSRLPAETVARSFSESVRPVFGSINLVPPDQRQTFGLRQLLRQDPLLVGSYLALSVAIFGYALFATRILPAQPTVGWVVTALYDVLWVLSFLWTGHFIVSLLPFIARIGTLPIRYALGMPDGLSLRSIGGQLVAVAWFGSLHFWSVMGLLGLWNVLGPHPGEPERQAAVITFSTIGVAALYLLELFLITFGTQVVMSRTMLGYRSRKQADLAYHLEGLFDAYLRTPAAASLKELEQRISQGDVVLKRLPRLSLSPASLLAFTLLLVMDAAAFALFVSSSIDGERLAQLWNALGG